MGPRYSLEEMMDDRNPDISIEGEWPADDADDPALYLFPNTAAADVESLSIGGRELSAEAREKILALYHECRPRLYRYLRSLRLRPDQADEIIQETFMRLTAQVFKENKIENVYGWITRVLQHLAQAVQKRERRWMPSGEGATLVLLNRPDPSLSPEETYSSKEQYKQIDEALSQLKPQQRQCFQMRAQGLRYRDIGQALGISEQRAAFVVKQIAVRLANNPQIGGR